MARDRTRVVGSIHDIGIGNAAARTNLLGSKIVEVGSLHFNDFKGRAIVPNNAFCCIGDPTPSS